MCCVHEVIASLLQPAHVLRYQVSVVCDVCMKLLLVYYNLRMC
jgi:hypothetical protein